MVKDIDEVRVLILDSKCSRLLTNAFEHDDDVMMTMMMKIVIIIIILFIIITRSL